MLEQANYEMERRVQREKEDQRNFNMTETSQRIQERYSSLRDEITTYYDRITGTLPLILFLQTRNPRLGEVIPMIITALSSQGEGGVAYSKPALVATGISATGESRHVGRCLRPGEARAVD